MRTAGLLVGLALLLPAAAGAASSRAEVKEQIKDARQDLHDARVRLKQNKAQLQQQAHQEKSLMSRLEELNRRLEAQRREARTHVKNLGVVQDRLTRTEARLKELDAEEEADRASLARSLAALYRTRGRSGASLVFGARSPSELGARVRYLSEISGATSRGVRALRERIKNVKEYREDYARQQDELKRERSEVELQRRRVEMERRKRLGLLRSVRSKKARTAEAVKELERSSGRLQGLLNNLQAEVARLAQAAAKHGQAPSAVGGPSTLRRGLSWPVRGRLISRYGKQRHPVFNTPVFNRGIEIAAPHGAPVQAVAAGNVLFAGAMEGFGDLAVLDHGGGMMSVYGYNSALRVKAGQGVAQGDVIAEVGENGTSDQPALYFEIRRGAKALNPFTYLRSR